MEAHVCKNGHIMCKIVNGYVVLVSTEHILDVANVGRDYAIQTRRPTKEWVETSWQVARFKVRVIDINPHKRGGFNPDE